MTKGLPRATIEELEARWQYSQLKLLFVEGASDQRYFGLLAKEKYCTPALRDLDVWPVDSVEVSSENVLQKGFQGTGAKQRAITLMRILEERGAGDGYRSLVDRDWDDFLGLHHDNGSVIYTDYCCREACLWSEQVLHRLIIQFRGDKKINSPEVLDALYGSIKEACAEIAVVRITNERHPEFNLGLDYSERAFMFENLCIRSNIEMLISQSKPTKGMLEHAVARAREIKKELKECDRRFLCHGHDLLFVITLVLKEFSTQAQREISVQHVENAFFMIGLIDDHISQSPAMLKIEKWLAGD